MPHPLTPLEPSAFERRWLAEALRRYEAEHGVCDDSALLPTLNTGDTESRILLRAERLIRTQHPRWLNEMHTWQSQTRWVILLLGVLALLSGFFSALSLINTGAHSMDGRIVNVVWMVLALLFIPVLSLLLWLVLTLLPGSSGQTPLGRLALWLQRHLPGQSPERLRMGQALLGLLAHHRLLGFGMSSLSHGLWLLTLGAVILGLLLMLATQRHVFVWETTILPGSLFVDFVSALGKFPALLGFAIPSREMILASGSAQSGQAELARHAWASWLVGCVVVYGILPRLAAFGVSFGLWKHGLATLRLDLKQPGYAMLRARLHQDSQALGVIDPAPAALPSSRLHTLTAHAPEQPHHPALVGFELGDDVPWPPENTGAFRVFPRIDSREERQHVLDTLHAAPPDSLLIAVDSRLSPDRGSLGFIHQLALHSATPLVWLMHDHTRSALWRSSLRAAGWPNDALLDDAAAKIWLQGAAT